METDRLETDPVGHQLHPGYTPHYETDNPKMNP